MSDTITRDAWIKALGDAAMPADPDALTTMEIAKLVGISPKAANTYINRLIANGLARQTKKIMPTAGGYVRRVAAYRLIDQPEKAVQRGVRHRRLRDRDLGTCR